MRIRIASAIAFALLLAGTAAAQTKTMGTLSCGKPDPTYAIPISDHAGHAFVLSKFACTWTKPMEIEGVPTKDGVDVVSGDAWGARILSTGYHFSNMANGDKIFVRFTGIDTMTKDGKFDTTSGKWNYTGGTGKFKGISGTGTYQGKADADGNVVTEVEGEYTLPQNIVSTH